MKRFLLAVFLLTLSEVTMSADKCEKHWSSLLESRGGVADQAILDEWVKSKSKCGSSWFYKYKQIALILSLGRVDEAKAMAESESRAAKDSSPFDFILIRIERLKVDPKIPSTVEELKYFERRYSYLIGKKISESPEFKIDLAQIKLLLHDVDGAIALARQSLEQGIDNEMPCWILLAEAYEQKGNYVAAKEALDLLSSLPTEKIFKNNRLLLLSFRILAAVGLWEAAERAINLAAENSELGASDPDVQKNLKYIKGKVASGEFKGPEKATKKSSEPQKRSE